MWRSGADPVEAVADPTRSSGSLPRAVEDLAGSGGSAWSSSGSRSEAWRPAADSAKAGGEPWPEGGRRILLGGRGADDGGTR